MKAIADASKGVRYGYNGEKVSIYEHPKNVNGRFSYGRTETGEVWNPDFRVATTKPVVKPNENILRCGSYGRKHDS